MLFVWGSEGSNHPSALLSEPHTAPVTVLREDLLSRQICLHALSSLAMWTLIGGMQNISEALKE